MLLALAPTITYSTIVMILGFVLAPCIVEVGRNRKLQTMVQFVEARLEMCTNATRLVCTSIQMESILFC